MKIQTYVSKRIGVQTVPVIKTGKYRENKVSEKFALFVVGPDLVKATTFNRSIHWATYLQQFEAAACTNNWTKKDVVISLALVKYLPQSCSRKWHLVT